MCILSAQDYYYVLALNEKNSKFVVNNRLMWLVTAIIRIIATVIMKYNCS